MGDFLCIVKVNLSKCYVLSWNFGTCLEHFRGQNIPSHGGSERGGNSTSCSLRGRLVGEKDAVEASLRECARRFGDPTKETTEQVAVMLDTWQSRFDRLYELADADGVDGAVLRSIREGSSA
jgi:hypothetical protein